MSRPWSRAANGSRANGLAVQVDVDLGVALGEQVQRGHGQLEGSAGGRRTRVQADPCPLGGVLQAVVVQVAAEVEVIGCHPVVLLESLGQPATGRHAVEAEPVGGLGEQGLAAGGVEQRLEVLHEIEAHAPRRRGQHRIGGFPRRREDRVGVVDALGCVADLGLQRGPPGAEGPPVLLQRPAVAVVQVHDALVARALER